MSNPRVFYLSTAMLLLLAAINLWWSSRIQLTISDLRCSSHLLECNADCAEQRDADLDLISIQEHFAAERHHQNLWNCSAISNPFQRTQCLDQENAAYGQKIRDFERQRANVQYAYSRCRLNCAHKAEDCQDKSNPHVASGTIDIPGDCRNENLGDESCRRRVDPLCTRISGCDDCYKTLCGGSTWQFESSAPIEVSVVSVAVDQDTSHTIIIGTTNGKKTLLKIPTDIKVGDNERLQFEFKPVKPQKEDISVTYSQLR